MRSACPYKPPFRLGHHVGGAPCELERALLRRPNARTHTQHTRATHKHAHTHTQQTKHTHRHTHHNTHTHTKQHTRTKQHTDTTPTHTHNTEKAAVEELVAPCACLLVLWMAWRQMRMRRWCLCCHRLPRDVESHMFSWKTMCCLFPTTTLIQ